MIGAAFLPQKNQEEKKYSFTKDTLKRLSRNKLAMAGIIILAILILGAIFAPLIAPYDYAEQNIVDAYMAPCAAHIFGTDEFGRDIFSRILLGARLSLIIGFIAVAIAIIVGGLLGALAGYYQKWVDSVIMRFMDILMSIPQLLLAIAITAVMGSSIINLMIAVGIAAIPGYSQPWRPPVITTCGPGSLPSILTTGNRISSPSGVLCTIVSRVFPIELCSCITSHHKTHQALLSLRAL